MEDQRLRIRLAGACAVGTFSGTWERSIPTSQGRLVLARLALAGAPVARDELAELLWPADMPQSWERHLSAVVSKLRRVLADAPASASIAGEPGTYELRLTPGSVVDVVDAAAALERGRQALAAGSLDEALGASAEAATVARRPFLPGTDALWADERRDAWRSVLLGCLDIAVEVAIRRGDLGGVAAAREALALDPYREAGYRNLMRLHLETGERAAASDVYRQCRAAFAGELGIEPSRGIEALWRSARDETPREEPPAEPLAPVSARPAIEPATRLVGRDGALAAVAAALRRSRLVTLTGTAGVGKSRLAFEAAQRLATQYPDGILPCELASVIDTGGVAHALAATVGVRQIPDAPIEQALVSALTPRRALLVVDNCEHVLDAISPLVEQILAHCRHVQVLATSRERLALPAETALPVQPLEVPEGGAKHMLGDREQPAPALELLCDRITAVRPDYRPSEAERAALAEICRQLDGLPLAIELAAARVSTMGAVEVAHRLDSRFALLTTGWRTAHPRHRTLRAAIEWSYDLLDPTQQRMFERVSVFVGGFTLAAAEQICAANDRIDARAIAEIVASLVDKSMLSIDKQPPMRYRMLETLRQFGLERLAARRDADATEEAHGLYFTALARRADSGLRGPEEHEWVELLDAERGNLRAARAWALRSGRPDVAADLSAALFWYAHWGMHSEPLAWADSLDPDALEPGPSASRALAAASDAAWKRADLIRARALGERAVAAAEGASAARYGWHMLGAVALFEGRLDDACDALDRVAALARRDGDDYHVSDALGIRALAQSYAGDPVAARASADESRTVAARSGSPTAIAWSAYASGEILAAISPDEALTELDRAVDLAQAVGAHFIVGVALLTATALRAQGDGATAAEAMLRVVDLWEQAGNWRQQWITLRGVAELLVRLGRDAAAAVALGAIAARDSANVYGTDAERLAKLRTGIELRLGPAAADEALAKGGNMDPVELIAFTRTCLRW